MLIVLIRWLPYAGVKQATSLQANMYHNLGFWQLYFYQMKSYFTILAFLKHILCHQYFPVENVYLYLNEGAVVQKLTFQDVDELG